MGAYFCSWSGGKDSCLALHRAVRECGPAAYLVNMLCEDGEHSRSHGIPRHLLQAQADAIGVPIHFGSATWADYEAEFIARLKELRATGIEAGVFGDIDLPEHREWEEKVCGAAGMTAHLPLRQCDHQALLDELLEAGYQARIVTVRLDALPEEFLGEVITPALVRRIADLEVDPIGEGGEFHTFVFDGPLFATPVAHTQTGVRRMEGYATLELGCTQ